ncbi:glycosyltransferase family 9 protein [Aequorivita echinoideorum]|uniref:Glycosyltransferase family 9 protein n=1 Tax=Aequorivita echinoideorum TaxID=1549647 RepID=A0ABS5S5J6_9FLAO|nr:glycosyltransferase family 9 protein [Aequorivita echinoideorum]MBT0608496.1 glycosyltransferase family 9 protein [Aequorivita echinoideorum]
MKKILVIQNKRIGDVLISSVIANNIKKVFPQSEVTYFVYDYTAGVLENNPNIDRIISVKEKKLKKFSNLLATVAKIRKEKYDIIFDPYSKFQSRLICLFSGAKYRIGLKRAHKELKFPFYTHPISFLEHRSKNCGKAIEDRINMIALVFQLEDAGYAPKIFLTEKEKNYPKIEKIQRPIIMLGILGSTPQKSMPYHYMVEIIDFITSNYNGTILFNYAPHQKPEAQKIYEMCKNKDRINLDIYENSIRGFIQLMNKCDMLVSNEGGSVHITKALDRPTFTIYSPYVNKEHWCSFEDGDRHDSIHLLEEKPDLFNSFTLEERRKIEEDPQFLYQQLTPEMIFQKLKPFLDHHLNSTINKYEHSR